MVEFVKWEPEGSQGLLQTLADEWSWRAIMALTSQPRRQSELASMLVPHLAVSTVSTRLRRLNHAGILIEERISARPPAVRFVLAEAGQATIPVCRFANLWEAGAPPTFGGSEGRHTLQLLSDPWVLPIMRRIAVGAHHRPDIREPIPGLTEKLLESRLRRLEAAGIIRCTHRAGFPSWTECELMPRGRALATLALLSSAWELRWGRPARPLIVCDLAGYLRIIAPLVKVHMRAHGICELTVNAESAIEPRVLLRAGDGRIEIVPKHQQDPPAARAAAAPLAWCQAFASGATNALQISGSPGLITDVVDGVHHAASGTYRAAKSRA